MGARSRRKGKVGELELARLLTAEGFPATRGAQHRGGDDSPDVRCPSLPGLHFEAKRREKLSLYDALDQARRDAGNRLPIVAHRRNGHPWVAVLGLKDLLAIVRESSFVEAVSEEPAALNANDRRPTESLVVVHDRRRNVLLDVVDGLLHRLDGVAKVSNPVCESLEGPQGEEEPHDHDPVEPLVNPGACINKPVSHATLSGCVTTPWDSRL